MKKQFDKLNEGWIFKKKMLKELDVIKVMIFILVTGGNTIS